jgi:ABC-type lipoprotein release transport system permease subunit
MLNYQNRYLFKFAWRSIRRNAGRSFFIGFSVSLAVVIAVWTVAFFDGMNHQIEKAVVNTNMGFFQIQDPLFSKSTDSSSPVLWTPELASQFQNKFIKGFSPELVLDGNISTPEGAAGLTVLGIEPELHAKFLPIKRRIKKGIFLDSNEIGQVVIGEELANKFKFNIDDQIVLNYQDINGELRSELLTIKGIYKYNSKGFEKKFIYINQPTWQTLFLNSPTGNILFNRIAIMTKSLENRNEIEPIIKNKNLILKTWKDLNPEMAVVLEFHDGMIRFFFLIIGITILMTILTPVRMLWQERYKELKMMAILGVAKNKFWKIGLFEVVLMIFFSGLFSILLLVSIVGTQSYTGVDFRQLNEGVTIERAGIKLPAVVYPLLSGEQLFITFLFVMLVVSISYIWSIYRTLQKLEAEI